MAKQSGIRLIAKNRRAHFDYELGDRYEAGLSLMGSEARSLREHAPDLTGAWVDVTGSGEAFVKGMRIPPLPHAAFGHEERRPRKLLLHRSEIDRLRGSIEREQVTIVVTQCYFKDGRAKVEIALARGRKKHDKRQLMRERDSRREAEQAIRRGRDE